jgi:phospholipid-binding lipoprotein MlaA
VIPILGPSDVRDGVGKIGDGFLSPLSYVNNNYIRYGVYGVYIVDTRYRLIPQERLLDESYDPYAFLRNAYLQRRQYLVTDGKLSDEDRKKQEQQQLDEEKRILEESGADDSSAPTPPASTPPGTPPEPSTPPEPPK